MIKPSSRIARLVPAVGSFVGLLIGCAVASRLRSSPAAGQLPGFALENGFNPGTGVLRLLVLLLAPILGGVAALRIAAARRRFAGPPNPAVAATPPEAPRRGLLPAAVAAHALAVWTLLVAPLSPPLGVGPGWFLAAIAALSLAFTILLGRGSPRAGAPWLGAASPVLALGFLGRVPGTLSVAGAVLAFALPLAARRIAAGRAGLTRAVRALTLVVFLPGSVTALAAAAVMRVPRAADIFEDGHALLPASEYLRGELPYRDIVPGHGLMSDGLLAAVELRLFGDDIRGLKRGEKVWGAFFWPSFYAIGYAATASPAFGMGGMILSFMAFPQYHMPRQMASLWMLALALYASRSKSRGAWLACGAVLPVGLCIAVEFTFYASCAMAVALAVARGRRWDHLRWMALGLCLSAGAVGAALFCVGILGGFLQTTFVFVPSLLAVYALNFPAFPVPRGVSQWLALPRDETALLYGFIAASLVLLGAFLPRAPRVGARARAALPICAWAFAAMLSVLERQHVGYVLLVAPIGLLLIGRAAQGRRPWTGPRVAAVVLVSVLLVGSRRPLHLLASAAWAMAHDTFIPADAVRLEEPPRARGGAFRPGDTRLVVATSAMLRAADMLPGDTWLDFANAPGLYYLFDRECPIRYYEPAFYESERAQGEVIAAVEGNPRVRAVLMEGPNGPIDGLSNARRAPRVAEFIRKRFRPFYREGDVEFWIRRGTGAPTSGRPSSSAALPP